MLQVPLVRMGAGNESGNLIFVLDRLIGNVGFRTAASWTPEAYQSSSPGALCATVAAFTGGAILPYRCQGMARNLGYSALLSHWVWRSWKKDSTAPIGQLADVILCPNPR